MPKAPFKDGFNLFKEDTEDFLLLASNDVMSLGCDNDLNIGIDPTDANGDGGYYFCNES